MEEDLEGKRSGGRRAQRARKGKVEEGRKEKEGR